MQKYYAIDLSTDDGPMRAAVYRADVVEKYRNDMHDIISSNERMMTHMANRIKELEALARG